MAQVQPNHLVFLLYPLADVLLEVGKYTISCLIYLESEVMQIVFYSVMQKKRLNTVISVQG